jgi:hypothetical protein
MILRKEQKKKTGGYSVKKKYLIFIHNQI